MDRFRLSQEPKFLNEWRKFSKGLKRVENEEYARDINELMDKLQKLVQDIDIGHDSDYNGYINPHGLVETRHEIQETRRMIHQKFQEMGITVR
mgnify:CR=1 FL=1